MIEGLLPKANPCKKIKIIFQKTIDKYIIIVYNR